MLRLYGIDREFESRDGIITFCLFCLLRFLSHFSLYYLPLIQLTSISVINYADRMNLLFPCDGAATHSCIMHDTGRGTLCKNASQIVCLHCCRIAGPQR